MKAVEDLAGVALQIGDGTESFGDVDCSRL